MNEELLSRLPKTDLHVHLEGSITPKTLLRIADKQNRDVPAEIFNHETMQFNYNTEQGFFHIYPLVGKFIQDSRSLEMVTTAFLEQQSEQNIQYSEVIYTAEQGNLDFDLDQQLAAIKSGRKKGMEEFGSTFNLVVDVGRQIPIDQVNEVLEWVIKRRDIGENRFLVGFGIGGMENQGLPQKYAKCFRTVKNNGLLSLPHAGEQLGPKIIWDTLHLLQPDRIGHGIRCVEDPKLLEELNNRQIPIDVCPLSNLVLGYYPSLEAHPIQKMLNQDLNISLGSDDPGIMNFTFTEQFLRLSDELKIPDSKLVELLRNGIRNSGLSSDNKLEMFSEVDRILNAWN